MAYYWRHLRIDPTAPPYRAPAPEDCPFRDFLLRHPAKNKTGIELLDILTNPNHPDKHQESSDQLRQWLLEQIRG
ncbi:hypothetical protein CARN8_1790001 [mine drainage metagenome]|uniref:Uncharacterized protein n=1 Tax=mine drainage metagenome TaxID=410659 RepID=A0A3P3ZM58_9ZZZZ